MQINRPLFIIGFLFVGSLVQAMQPQEESGLRIESNETECVIHVACFPISQEKHLEEELLPLALVHAVELQEIIEKEGVVSDFKSLVTAMNNNWRDKHQKGIFQSATAKFAENPSDFGENLQHVFGSDASLKNIAMLSTSESLPEESQLIVFAYGDSCFSFPLQDLLINLSFYKQEESLPQHFICGFAGEKWFLVSFVVVSGNKPVMIIFDTIQESELPEKRRYFVDSLYRTCMVLEKDLSFEDWFQGNYLKFPDTDEGFNAAKKAFNGLQLS